MKELYDNISTHKNKNKNKNIESINIRFAQHASPLEETSLSVRTQNTTHDIQHTTHDTRDTRHDNNAPVATTKFNMEVVVMVPIIAPVF